MEGQPNNKVMMISLTSEFSRIIYFSEIRLEFKGSVLLSGFKSGGSIMNSVLHYIAQHLKSNYLSSGE